MKDRILNILMVVVVIIALIFSMKSQKSTELPKAFPQAPVLTAAPTVQPILAYRSHRVEIRHQEEALLQAMIQNDATSPEMRAQAEQMILEIAGNAEIELAAEAALAAQGYPLALCVARSGSVTILMDAELSRQEAALLIHLVQEASGLTAENIRIAPC